MDMFLIGRMSMRTILATTAALLGFAAATAAHAQAAVTSVWNTSEGQMTLVNRSNHVTGTYTTDNGRIVGTYAGNRLSGYWIESMADRRCPTALGGSFYWGRILFVFNPANRTFHGRWSYCGAPVPPGSGGWSGQLIRMNVSGLPAVPKPIAGPGPLPVPGPGPITNPFTGQIINGGGGGSAAPAARPCFTNSGAIADVGPCNAPVGASLTVRQLRSAGAPLGRVIFKAVLANGVPAQVTVPLTGSGPTFSAAVVPQLCAQGGPSWDVWLQTTTGQNQGVIGRFQPDCR
jgi:hypothetical protein